MDIFSYGQILQFIVTSSPHNGTDRVKIGRYINGDKIHIIDKIIDKCLSFEPENRYQSMEEIIKELSAFDAPRKEVKFDSKTSDIDENEIYEFICINDVASTKEIAEKFNYDIHNLKNALIRLYKVKRKIIPETIIDRPKDDNCKWIRDDTSSYI